MTIEQAIQKAIEGGLSGYELCRFDDGGWILIQKYSTGIDTKAEEERSFTELCLDPLFWQALGKSMGWDNEVCDRTGRAYTECSCGYNPESWTITECGGWNMDKWLYHWHQFIDHLAQNKTIESFFEQL